MWHPTIADLPDEQLGGHTATLLEEMRPQPCLAERFQQAQKMEVMGHLTAGVAHDFNNLVTIMSGYSAILLNHLSVDDPLYEAAEEINKASERAASLARQLMGFSRKQSRALCTLDLNIIVTDIEKMLRRLIGENIELCTVLDPTLGPVQADRHHIEQVIINLVVNARDAMPSGGRLTLATTNTAAREAGEEAYIKLSVCDTGCGMNTATRTRLFEPFFTTKKLGKGTGLGLAMVHEIVQNSGGRIRVDSAPGLGTTFDIYLPRAEPAAEPVRLSDTPDQSLHGSETILLVEDDTAVRSVICSVLRRHGYTVLEASHGKAALLLSARCDGPIHLLLTDVVMPHLGGHALARYMTSLHPGIKILYMSGYADAPYLPQHLKAPEVAFLSKPFTPHELARQVRWTLNPSVPRGVFQKRSVGP